MPSDLSFDDLGWGPFFDRQISEDERARWTPARVVWEGRERYRLSTGGHEWRADLAGRTPFHSTLTSMCPLSRSL